MPTITVNGLTLCHKGDSAGFASATLPDVCWTPAPVPSGQVPIPYPNMAFARDLAKGTTTVLADGGNMIANFGSEFSRSTGDEPGVRGGIVSGTYMKEATWITFSFNVFMQRKGACRLTDMMLMNHGNTVSMGGYYTNWLKEFIAKAIKGELTDLDCEELLEKINDLLNGYYNKKDPSKSTSPNNTKGVKQRFFEQIYGAIKPGETGWDEHNNAFKGIRDRLRKYLEALDDFCDDKDPPSDGWEWATRRVPVPADYLGPVTTTAPRSIWSRIGWGLAGAGLTVVTVVAVISPFDGPAGDILAGSGAAAAWARAFGTAGSLAGAS